MAQDPSEVRAAIAQDRLELGDTVQALAQKADLKQRVQDKANDAVTRVRSMTPEQVQSGLGSAADSVRQRPFPVALAAAFLFGLLVGRRWRRDQ